MIMIIMIMVGKLLCTCILLKVVIVTLPRRRIASRTDLDGAMN